ncbi:cation-translocating P-type ATPase [Undibacterium sp. Xuan67W]|uniref:cation-translocating P-type ATPase n=1 Tax=Undibacterium sp. Xuan67W TaxID=3413057 RepID=UPI003BF1F263
MTDFNSPHQGLSDVQIAEQRDSGGFNELVTSKPGTILHLVKDIVTEPMFLLLLACGGIYMALGNLSEALMLLAFVFVVMAMTFFQQRRTERSLDALRDLSSPQALVIRNKQLQKIDGRELVYGDIVLLSEGDRVPADIVILDTTNLTVDESMLTGESVPVLKQAIETQSASQNKDEYQAINLVYSGTLVTRGTATGRVTAIGQQSALGKIGLSLTGITQQNTPIQKETALVVKRVAVVGLLLACVLALVYWLKLGDWLHGVLAGLTLAMAVLPEELPVILTIFLGLGAWRLAKEKVLARSIPAIELLGATTILCVDKTGTLTTNRMAVRRLQLQEEIFDFHAKQTQTLQENLHETLEFAILASHRRAFDPMETAIANAGKTLLSNTEHLHTNWTLIDDYPLSHEMLAMSRVWQSPDQSAYLIAAKGAPEAIIDLCHLHEQDRTRITEQVLQMAADGLRVLGVARAEFHEKKLPEIQHDFDFEFLGLVGLEDPVRDDVATAIQECHEAGIRVVMITGDHPATALSIAKQAGLATGGDLITGTELSTISDEDLQKKLMGTDIFCRVQPDQKLRLVNAYRAHGEIVAMTGDGVNDAPALKAANIGVAMGARGTDVAREAAALVLLNDDFSSLVTAVRYGRRVFSNLKKAIVFVVAVHVPIVGLSLIPVLLGWPMLLMPVHVLSLQLIIDPACSVIFEAEPQDTDNMKNPPRSSSTRLFDKKVVYRGLWQGAGLLLTLIGLFAWARASGNSDDSARALTFFVLVLSNLGLILANRSLNQPAWTILRIKNPYFWKIVVAAIVALTLIMTIPFLAHLFSFSAPSTAMYGFGVGVVVLNTFWFECVKKFA